MRTVLLFTILILALSCSKKVMTAEAYDVSTIKELASVPEPMETKPIYVFRKKSSEPIKTVIIYFDFDSYEIKNSELWKMSNIEHPIELIGGSCPIGTDYYNYSLGIKRCSAVIEYFSKREIKVDKYKSVGEHELVTYNKSEYNLNRRCEVRYK